VYPGRSLSSIAYLLAFATSAGAQELQLAQPQGRDWQGEVVQVHARFHGRPGTFAQFGDSITETLAFWTPLRHARTHSGWLTLTCVRNAGGIGRARSSATKAAGRSGGPRKMWRPGWSGLTQR
jgi:hypothetical protein